MRNDRDGIFAQSGGHITLRPTEKYDGYPTFEVGLHLR